MEKLAFALIIAIALLFPGCASSPLNEGKTADGKAYRGASAPKVVIYEYSDFECPYCGTAVPVVDELVRAHASEVQLQFLHFPLTGIHPRSMPSAIAAVCADEQGKFWQMHDRLFSSQNSLEDADLKKYAGEMGLDGAEFASCIVSPEAAAKVKKDMASGAALGVRGTPSFYVGSTLAVGTGKLRQIVETELAKAG
jgi:protein-disulfide isomerase